MPTVILSSSELSWLKAISARYIVMRIYSVAESSREIFQSICEKVRDRSFSRGRSASPSGADSVDKLIKEIAVFAHSEFPKVGADKEALVEKVLSQFERENSTKTLKADLSAFAVREKTYFDQHRQLAKIEHAQGLRNLIWRAATTFTIASIIFFFYWLAGCLGISMPLSRVGL